MWICELHVQCIESLLCSNYTKQHIVLNYKVMYTSLQFIFGMRLHGSLCENSETVVYFNYLFTGCLFSISKDNIQTRFGQQLKSSYVHIIIKAQQLYIEIVDKFKIVNIIL